MLMTAAFLLTCLACALTYRGSGGWMGMGKIPASMFFVSAMSLVFPEFGFYNAGFALTFLLGRSPGYGEWLDQGTAPHSEGGVKEDALGMAYRFMFFAAPSALYAATLGLALGTVEPTHLFMYGCLLYIFPGGFILGGLYYLTRHQMPAGWLARLKKAPGDLIDGPTAVAELLIGFFAPFFMWLVMGVL